MYTLVANYIHPEGNMYDPNFIREEIAYSKEVLLSLVLAKSLLNTYRVMNQDAKFVPMIWLDKKSAALFYAFHFDHHAK